MKHFGKILLIAIGSITLTSCDFLSLIIGEKGYDNYEDYFIKDLEYEKFTDMDSFNKKLDDTAYFWTISEGSTSTSYFSGKALLFSVYKSKEYVTLYNTQGQYVYVERKDGVLSFTCKESELRENEEGIYLYRGVKDPLKAQKYDDGYLIVAYGKFMYFVTNDLKTVYVNEDNSKVFKGYQGTKNIPDSDLLNETLALLEEDTRIKLPAPEGDNIEIWYGLDYYKGKPSHTTAYFANVHPVDYVEILKKNGFTVNRSYEDPYYGFYGKNGGYWYCFDEKEEIECIVRLQNYLYTTPLGKTYGPLDNTEIMFYKMKKGYFGEKETTTVTDWSESDKATFATWYDGGIDPNAIPFIPLGKRYSVPTIMSFAHTGILDGTLSYHHQCYNITDDSPYYLLDGYDQILENNGFHKFVPAYDLDVPKEKSDFFNTDDCKYVECFINDEKDMAIKYYFDTTFGNTIRVFKKSLMTSWLVDLEED